MEERAHKAQYFFTSDVCTVVRQSGFQETWPIQDYTVPVVQRIITIHIIISVGLLRLGSVGYVLNLIIGSFRFSRWPTRRVEMTSFSSTAHASTSTIRPPSDLTTRSPHYSPSTQIWSPQCNLCNMYSYVTSLRWPCALTKNQNSFQRWVNVSSQRVDGNFRSTWTAFSATQSKTPQYSMG